MKFTPLSRLTLCVLAFFFLTGADSTPVSRVKIYDSAETTAKDGIPAALGQTTMTNSMPVTFASNQSALGVTQSTSPWVTSRNWNLGFATDSVTVRLNDGSGNSLNSDSNRLYIVGGDSAGIFNSGRVLTVQGAGIGSAPIQSNVTSSVLPTGAATETTLSTLNGKIPSNLTVTSTRLLVDPSGVTSPVSVSSLPLPTGAATSANQTTINTSVLETHGPVSPGTAATKSELVGGVYNSTDPTLSNTQQSALQLDVNGKLKVTGTAVVTNSKDQTYSATAIFTAAASPTDVFTITGSASKTVKILSFYYSATKTANGFGNVILIRRSTANTGGTSATATIAKLDSNNAAATAVVRNYTANPSALGTTAGNIFATRFFYSGLSSFGDEILLNFDENSKQPITLRGTSELLAVNLNAVTQAGNSIAAAITWSEE